MLLLELAQARLGKADARMGGGRALPPCFPLQWLENAVGGVEAC